MRFNDRREWLYDPALFGLPDTQTALKIHAEYVRKMSPRPLPRIFEVDRDNAKIDTLWYMPLEARTMFSRTLDMPAIVKQEKPRWRMTKQGMVPQQSTTFWLANLIMQELDYFPMRGDLFYYNGYRFLCWDVVLDPSGMWQQTNVWLGMTCACIIPPDGDARPILNPGEPVPAEIRQSHPLPEA